MRKINGSSPWGYSPPFWTFKKGFHYDYSQERFDNWVSRNPNPHEGWDVERMIKPEGAPVQQASFEELPILGHWWSVQFRCGKFLTRFRYRSWTENIFYITWGGF